MRTFLIATAVAALAAATPATAQQGNRHGGNGGSHGGSHGGGTFGGVYGGGWSGGGWSGGSSASASAHGGAGGAGGWTGGRWGQTVNGRWYGGVRAPGGWNAYRRPQRGWAMPGYWRSPNWAITDWQLYGLRAPPIGYGWSRYYDDAVLVDDRGYVYDSVGDVDWRRADQPYATGYGYPSQGYYNAPDGDYRGVDPRCYEVSGRKRGGSGIGGALVGGAIGAGIGAATGGLGATLIGGGLGALGGQAIDRNSRRGEIVCDDQRRGAGYGGGAPDYGPPPGYGAPGHAYAGDGYAYAEGGHGGYTLYAPGVTATATVEFDAPVTTTTTTTTVTEEWVYPRTTRRTVRKWRPRSKLIRCSC